MKRIVIYLACLAVIDVVLMVLVGLDSMPESLRRWNLVVLCSLIGGLGGVVYCLRGAYLSACVNKAWSNEWIPWYYIRPLVSHMCGAISYVFLKAGLLLLEAEQSTDASDLGFLALAFIAGLNVDGFIKRIEDIAHSSWGIQKSRASTRREQNANPDI